MLACVRACARLLLVLPPNYRQEVSLLRSRFLGCHATLPPKETAAHIRTTFLSIVWPITAFVPFSRTLSRQIRPLRLVQSEIIFYLPIIWWETHTSTMPTIATIATLEEACLLAFSRFNTAGLNAYWKLAMRKIVNEKDDIFVNVPFVNLSKICLA